MADSDSSKSDNSDLASAKSSSIDPKIAGLLAWIFAPVSSIIFLLIEPDNEFIRFHSMQSLIYSVINFILFSVFGTCLTLATAGLFAICLVPLAALSFVVNIIGAIKSYQGEMWELPIIGKWSKRSDN